jgi:hypothetical protein
MAYRRRIFFTDKQKSEIWDRWQRGESMRSIGRSFNRGSSSIHPMIARAGGFPRTHSTFLSAGARVRLDGPIHRYQS